MKSSQRGEVRWTRFIVCIDRWQVTNFVDYSTVGFAVAINSITIDEELIAFAATCPLPGQKTKKADDLSTTRLTTLKYAFWSDR